MANQRATLRQRMVCEAVRGLLAYASQQGLTGDGMTPRDYVEAAADAAAFAPRVRDALHAAAARWSRATTSERRFGLRWVVAGNRMVIEPQDETDRAAG